MSQYINQVGYGLTQALQDQAPLPVKSKRAPTANDVGHPLGQVWVNIPANAAYVLTSVVNNQANWQALAGGSGSFSTLTVTGQVLLDTTAVTNNQIGNNTGTTSVQIFAGSNGITLASASGPIGITSGTGTITIGGDPNAKNITIGNDTGATGVFLVVGTGGLQLGVNNTDHPTSLGALGGASATTIRGGTSGITLNAPFVSLPGPVYIYSGSGTPSGGLALHVGDLFINSTAATATTRLFIATAVGVWTNVTCAA